MSPANGFSVGGSGSVKGQIVNLLLVDVWLLLQCGKLCQGVTLLWREQGIRSVVQKKGLFSPLPACFNSSLPTASCCQMEAMMDPCRSKNDASLPCGKLLQIW